MKEVDPNQNRSSSPDEALDLLLSQAPLVTPSDWFVSQTIARIRRESTERESRWLHRIWAATGTLALLLLWVGVEIHQQSQNELLSVASLDASNWSEGTPSEDSWLGH